MTTMSPHNIVLIQNEKKSLQDLEPVFAPFFKNVLSFPPGNPLEDLEGLQPDIIFLEYSVSDMSGILFFKRLMDHPQLCLIPTVFISDSKSREYRLNAFEIGASGYIRRPFDKVGIHQATLAYIQGRKHFFPDKGVSIGNLSLDLQRKEVRISGEKVNLTEIEYRILSCLLATTKQIRTRSEIYDFVWGKKLNNTGRLDTQLYNLKKKLKDFNGKIKSVNKIGLRVLAESSTYDQEPRVLELEQRPLAPHP